jgi:2-octaprenyl-6-methoxyphenol hydroxylase
LLSDLLPAQAMRAGGLWALKLSPRLRKQAFSLGMGVR